MSLLAAALVAAARLGASVQETHHAPLSAERVMNAESFGLKLFEALCTAEPTSTVVLSPLVIAGALSLAAAGATPMSTTEAELLGVLGIGAHADHAALTGQVLSGNGATVRTANGVFTKASIKPAFVSLVQSVHRSEAAPLGPSYAPINSWVAEKTEGRIKNLLQDPVDPLVVAVLVSAVFFKGAWAEKFSPAHTQAHTFLSLTGERLAAQLMQRTGSMVAGREVAALGGAAAVRLDYGSRPADGAAHDYCALFVLPQEATAAGLAATVAAVASASPREVLAQLRSQRVRLRLPRLRAEFGAASVKAALRSLGVAQPFDGTGGFHAMSDDPHVHVDDVVTKAMIEMDEEGTVAAAAAAAVMMRRSAPRPPLELTFDRPFVMAILHVPTGYPLFLARVLEPGV